MAGLGAGAGSVHAMSYINLAARARAASHDARRASISVISTVDRRCHGHERARDPERNRRSQGGVRVAKKLHRIHGGPRAHGAHGHDAACAPRRGDGGAGDPRLQAHEARRRRHAPAVVVAGTDPSQSAFRPGREGPGGLADLYEPLAAWDGEGNLVPILAAEIPSHENGGVSRDGLSVTWKLKRNVRWHDGRPFTAEDVVFNCEYAADPATAAVTLGVYREVKASKIDDYT